MFFERESSNCIGLSIQQPNYFVVDSTQLNVIEMRTPEFIAMNWGSDPSASIDNSEHDGNRETH